MAGEIEWIEPDPPSSHADVIDAGGPRRPPWRWWYALVAIAAVAALLVVTRPGQGRPAASASTTPSPPSPGSSTRYPGSPEGPGNPSTAVGSPTVVAGPSVLDVPAGWQLFARASDAVIKIELASGKVTMTPIPLLSSSGPASFVIGPDRVIVRPLDVVAGYEVRDGQSYAPLPAGFAASGPALPGPDPAHLWVVSQNGQSMTLVGFDGISTGTTLTVPPTVDVGSVQSDDAGYLQFSDVGGIYDLRPSGIERITTGLLLASGPTAWLTEECSDQHVCVATAIDRRTGARHALTTPVTQLASGGVISPDGAKVAVLEGNESQPARLHLIDLATGADRPTDVTLNPDLVYQDGLFIWSPDSRWLFATNATGRMYAVDAQADVTTTLNVTLGPISQLGLRTASSGN